MESIIISPKAIDPMFRHSLGHGQGPPRGGDGSAQHAGCPELYAEEANKQMGLSENSVPLHPMVLLIIIPTKWL